MQDWSLPGVAVAVVQAGGGTTLKTYGKRQWDRELPLTERSMFGIASVTKTFVAAGVALLEQDGKLDYDDPVIRHLPEFRVQDPWVTAHVTIRDLLAHRSGIASHGDFFEELPDLDENAAVRMLASYGQSMPFRAGAQYSSYTYIVLDRIIERLSGKPWGQFLRERLWQPLGMRDTYAHAFEFVPPQNVLPTGDGWLGSMPTGLAAVGPEVDVAAPHVRWEAFFGGKAFYDRRELENGTVHFHRTVIDSGQGVFSSIRDMAAWASLLLAGGDERTLQPGTLRDMLQLTSLEARDWPFDVPAQAQARERVRDVGFGLGIAIYHRGQRVLFGHSGSELGYLSWMLVDPRAGLAVVILTNNFAYARGSVPALMETVLDWHYDQPKYDWSSHYKEASCRNYAESRAGLDRITKPMPGDRSGAPAVDALVGEYHSPLTGMLRIEARGSGLVATTGRSYEIELQHLRRNAYFGHVVSPMRIPMLVTFDLDTAGRATGLHLERAGDSDERLDYARQTP